jgi:hypothetical protein
VFGPFTPAQQQLSDAMVNYWTQFAKTGNPNSIGAPKWSRYSSGGSFESLVPPTPKPESDASFDTDHNCSSFWNTFRRKPARNRPDMAREVSLPCFFWTKHFPRDDVFAPRYRGRTTPLIIATLLGDAAAVAVSTWIYYHAVSVVKLTPTQGSIILLVGGTLSTAGLVIGIRMSELIGRVRSVFVLGLAGTIGVLAFYWDHPRNSPGRCYGCWWHIPTL